MPRKLNGWQQHELGKREGRHGLSSQPTEFEQLVAKRGLTEAEAADDPVVRSWIKKKYPWKYVPEEILQYMGIELTDSRLGFGSPVMIFSSSNHRSTSFGIQQKDSL